MAPDADFCEECGAALTNDPAHLSGSDSAIYPELARANLFRMRGEFRKAEDVCRAILRRYPNNATAAGLLGDLCAEEGQLEDAVRWYELAIDAAPDSAAEKQKLDAVTQRLKEREALTTAQQLGLPTTKPRAGLFAVLLLGLIFAISAAAFLWGRQSGDAKPKTPGSTVNMPFEAGSGGSTDPNAPVTNPTTTPTPEVASETNELITALKAKSSVGARILDAWLDPRSKTVHLSFRLEAGDNDRLIASQLAQSIFDQVVDAQSAQLRGIRDGKSDFFADSTRQAALAADPTLATSNPEAFASATLANEWPAPTPGKESPPAPDPGHTDTNDATPAPPNDNSTGQ